MDDPLNEHSSETHSWVQVTLLFLPGPFDHL
uniref:Uncharacterized protein n=1 Tax=Anguilla anguilla TaxID=7936 RepID=A0A0E9XX04_ANGAN